MLSPSAYNAATSLALCCPITSQVKGYPFEVALQGAGAVNGVVLADQIRNLDWRAQNAEFAARAGQQVVADVLAKVLTLLK